MPGPTQTRQCLNTQGFSKVLAKSLAQYLARVQEREAPCRELTLKQNDITVAGAAALARLLERASLTKLTLSVNEFGDDGAAALGEALKAATGLRELVLEGCAVGRDGAKALVEGLVAGGSLQKLDLACAAPP